jgi:hypothetical protein
MVKQLMRLHGGTVAPETEGPGKRKRIHRTAAIGAKPGWRETE